MDPRGKGCVVVGGGSGMGRASAALLHERGGRVAILDLPDSAGAEAAAGLGADVSFHPCDVSDHDGTQAALESAAERLGGLHIAVNTAGAGTYMKTITSKGPHPLEEFQRIVDLNLVGTFNLNRLQAWLMRDNPPEDDERGVIVNTASIAAYEGQSGQVAYTAAKAGIAGMSLTMARDLGPLGIRVNAIAPGLFETGITAGMPNELRDQVVGTAAFPKRMGRPEEYARLVVALVENPMLNGSTLRLDGGQRLPPQ